jgi:hypothetical protein
MKSTRDFNKLDWPLPPSAKTENSGHEKAGFHPRRPGGRDRSILSAVRPRRQRFLSRSQNTPTPGVQMAQTLSTITGVAISPLLGVSAVGCYQYCQARTAEQKTKLPWFASPWFWGPAFLLLAVCFREGHRRRGVAQRRQKTVRCH